MTFSHRLVRRLAAFLAALAALPLLSCGGGGSGSSASPATPVVPVALTNFTALTVDSGPPALQQGSDGYLQANVAYASVTLCAPGTATCQTIDHVAVDTGSVGLRILASVLTPAMLAALPQATDTGGNPVGECYGFVDGYVFGSVRQADFQIGGERVAGMPLQVIGDAGRFAGVPTRCSAGGGTNITTVKNLGANGIIGVGVTTTDCGANCTVSGGYGAAIYYDCPATGCSAIITRAISTTAPFQQLPNPVAAMSVDNNGTVFSLPAPPAAGAATLTGTLFFGIGTQTNNALPTAATVLPTTTSTSALGPGLLTAVYGGKTLTDSYVDSGSTAYFFVDNAITRCTTTGAAGFYCPASPLTLSATIRGQNSASKTVSFLLNNAATLLQTDFAALPGLGANPNAFTNLSAPANSFDFGLPFFYGRDVYTAIEGRTGGAVQGPYVAF